MSISRWASYGVESNKFGMPIIGETPITTVGGVFESAVMKVMEERFPRFVIASNFSNYNQLQVLLHRDSMDELQKFPKCMRTRRWNIDKKIQEILELKP